MEINSLTLFEAAGFPCLFRDAEAAEIKATAVYVTPEALRRKDAHEDKLPADAETGPGVKTEMGTILVMHEANDGPGPEIVSLSFNGGEDRKAFLRVDDEIELSLAGPGTLRLREILRNRLAAREDADVEDVNAHRAMSGLNGMFEIVRADQTNRFSADMLATAFHAYMSDSLGDTRLPVSPEEYARYCQANTLRGMIGQTDPSHADALQSFRPLHDILREHAVSPSDIGTGSDFRGSMGTSAEEGQMIRAVAANERLTREVFGRLTATSVENLSAAIVSMDAADRLRQSEVLTPLSGDWVDQARAATEEAFGDPLPGYEFQMDIFSKDGRDIMVVDDSVGRKAGKAYVYSWPTAQRNMTVRMDDADVLQLSSEEIPDEAEVQRLAAIVDDLRHDLDVEPDDGDPPVILH